MLGMLSNDTLPVSGSPHWLRKQEPDTPISLILFIMNSYFDGERLLRTAQGACDCLRRVSAISGAGCLRNITQPSRPSPRLRSAALSAMCCRKTGWLFLACILLPTEQGLPLSIPMGCC